MTMCIKCNGSGKLKCPHCLSGWSREHFGEKCGKCDGGNKVFKCVFCGGSGDGNYYWNADGNLITQRSRD